ncbi:MAG: hypothetical protein K0S30_193 [Clostridia bacterium]|nr:hypothetical protein [Clostridia bacterium]
MLTRQTQLIKKSNESLTYKIGEVSIDGETAIVNVSCTYGDVKAIFGVAFSEYMQKAIAAAFSETPPSEEEIDKMLSDEIVSALNSTPPTEHSAELKVNCIKTDGKWAIDTSTENTELADVLTGNLVSTFTEMAKDKISKSKG